MVAASELQQARQSGSSDSELLGLADQVIEALEADLIQQKETYDGLLLSSQEELAKVEEAKNEAQARTYALRERIAALEVNLKLTDAKTPIPSDLKELETWAHQHLEGSVTLLSRALRGAKKSEYENPTLVYEALLLLHDFYVPMKRDATAERHSACEAELNRLGLKNDLVGNAVNTFKDDYTVNYSGQKRVLNMHLKDSGNSREPRLCLRIYYFWDEESRCVVVGWLTSHLSNAST